MLSFPKSSGISMPIWNFTSITEPTALTSTINSFTWQARYKLSLDTYYFEADHNFTTSHDYKVAKIIANDLIQVYLEDQLNNNNQRKLFETRL
jgi:hypothetical protein